VSVDTDVTLFVGGSEVVGASICEPDCARCEPLPQRHSQPVAAGETLLFRVVASPDGTLASVFRLYAQPR